MVSQVSLAASPVVFRLSEEVEAEHLIPDLSFLAQNNVTQSPASDPQLSANRGSEFPGSDYSHNVCIVLQFPGETRNIKSGKNNNPLCANDLHLVRLLCMCVCVGLNLGCSQLCPNYNRDSGLPRGLNIIVGSNAGPVFLHTQNTMFPQLRLSQQCVSSRSEMP